MALLGLEGKWAKIQNAQGTTGYVFSAYLAPSGDTAAAYYAATDLNLRAGPGMSHEVVGELLEGETVKRLHTVGNWALVEGEKGIGYAFTRYLSIRTPAQPEASGGRMRFATLEDAGALYGDCLLYTSPASLPEALKALEEDHEYLLQGDVFSELLIKQWIDKKRKDAALVEQSPHPREFEQYYDL